MAKYLITLSGDSYANNTDAASAIANAGASVSKTLNFGLTFEIEATPEQLAAIPDVVMSEQSDAPIAASLQAVDPSLGHLNYLVDLANNVEYNPAYTGAGQIVYVVDTGVNTNHPEFASRSAVVPRYSAFTADPAISDYDDEADHGTAVAALINGAVLGVSKDAIVHNVKLFNDISSTTTVGAIIDALDAVLGHHQGEGHTHAKTVCCAWTIPQNNFVDAKIRELNANNLVVVCAAGNDGVDVDTKSPAGVNEVITCGSFNEDLEVGSFTNLPLSGSGTTGFNNYGSAVDIFAFSVGIKTAVNPGQYAFSSGTSFAAGITAGAAAQYIEKYNTKTSDQIKDVMLAEGHNSGVKYLVFDNSDPNVDYSQVYKSLVTVENTGQASLASVPSGRLLEVQLGSSASVNVGLNPSATDVTVLEFAPLAPWMAFDTATGELSVDTSGLASDKSPGVFSFAVKGVVAGKTLVEEYSIGVYTSGAEELSDATSYYYDADAADYDAVVNYTAAGTPKP